VIPIVVPGKRELMRKRYTSWLEATPTIISTTAMLLLKKPVKKMWERHLAAIEKHFKVIHNPPAADYRAKDERFESNFRLCAESWD
jgi:hypothetical protein